MDKIILKTIKIKNFKGIASYETEFDDKVTEIAGSNGSGKSSIKNAWEWVLCQNVPDVLPMLNNIEIPELVTSVECNLLINNIAYTLKRESRGKYTKNEDGSSTKISNENSYFIDGIPLGQKQYQEKIAGILGNSTFNNLVLLTNKDYFNEETNNWNWTNRRKLLSKMCNVDDIIVQIINKEEYANIKPYIAKGYATSDIKTLLKKEKAQAKSSLDKNNILIENKQLEIAEFSKMNFEELAKQLEETQNKYSELLAMNDSSKNTEQVQNLQNTLLEETKKLAQLQANEQIQIYKLRKEVTELYSQAQKAYTDYSISQKQVDSLTEQLSKFDNTIEDECPTCHRKYDEETIEQYREIRNQEYDKLDAELTKAQKINTKLGKEYKNIKSKYDVKKQELDNFTTSQDINNLTDVIKDTKQAIADLNEQSMNNLSANEIKCLESQINELQQDIAKKQFIEKGEQQIKQWKNDNITLSDFIRETDAKMIALDKFIQEQVDTIVSTINSKFTNGISWSLYNITYKNGEGGIKEDCVCMYNGKRYSSLSTGEKNVANLEVVKVLQDFFGVNITIFADNDEGVTIPYESDRQIIKLIAKPNTQIENLIKIGD